MDDEEPFSQPFQAKNILKLDELQEVPLTPSQSDNEEDYTDENTPLLGNIKIPEEIERIESSCWGWFNYRNIKNTLFKLLSPLFTNKHALDEKEKKKCTPLSMWGGSFPLKEQVKRNRILKIGGSTIEDFLVEFTKTSLLGFGVYEFFELIKSGQSVLSGNFIENFYTAVKKFAYYREMIQALYYHPVLFAFLAVPFGLAVIKGLVNISQISKSTEAKIEERIKNVNLKSKKWDSRFFPPIGLLPSVKLLLIFHPMKQNIRALTSSILWESALPPKTQKAALSTLIDLAKTRKCITQMTAIEGLADLVHGLNLKDLNRTPHKEILLKIKVEAYNALQEVYKNLPRFSFNKIKTAILLWEIGYSPSKKTSVIMPILKAIELSIYGGFLYGIGFFLYKYMTCSVKYFDQFLWMNDFQPYVSPYDKPCYGIQEKGFNTLPHQTAETLIGSLKQYGFPNNLYDSDLSGKHIKGDVLVNITQEFVRQKKTVSLNSLNIGNNAVINSLHIEQIFENLPGELESLDATNMAGISYAPYSPSSFLALARLSNLKNLILSYNRFSPNDNGVLAEVVKNLPYLQELRIASVNTNLSALSQNLPRSLRILDLRGCDLSNAGDQIALGKALAQNLRLRELYLGSASIGASSEGNKALAGGLVAQSALTVLEIGSNSLGSPSSSILLSSLPPSITNLDVSNNDIGVLSDALAQSVQQMEGLTCLKAANNNLNSPDLLNVLYDKKNLTSLDFYQNNFQNSSQISNLLQTIPALKGLDLSNNMLTNGATLATGLGSLPNLKSLKLMGNNFITSDRIAIWNATSTLSKSPFYLDEDPIYTTYYLNSLNPNTTSLDISGLIQNNATALDPIMQHVVIRFSDLEELDMSENAIGNSDSETNTPKGIQGLTTYLPQLKNLKSLKMTNCYGYILPEMETYFRHFSYTIGQLANISILDLSGTNLLYAKDLGNGFNKSQNLTSVKLDRCWGGPAASQWEGGTELFEGLKSHSNLTSLSASLNPIGIDSLGSADPNSTLALANALSSWPQLHNLVLPYTYIGYNDTDSLDVFLQKLGEFAAANNKPGKNLQVNFLNGIYNSTWSKEVDAFRKLMNQSVIDNCARELCTGKLFSQCQQKKNKERVTELLKLPKEPKEDTVISSKSHAFSSYKDPVTSSSSRLTPFYQPLVNFLEPWFSKKAWSIWGSNTLDSVANAIQNYSRSVVENAPSYFPGKLPPDSKFELYNYSVPHSRARNTTLMLEKPAFDPRENITNMIFLQSPQSVTLPTNYQPIGLLSK